MASRTIEVDAELLAKACDAMSPASVEDAEGAAAPPRHRSGHCVSSSSRHEEGETGAAMYNISVRDV
jgi:hypothetical protein